MNWEMIFYGARKILRGLASVILAVGLVVAAFDANIERGVLIAILLYCFHFADFIDDWQMDRKRGENK